MKPSEVRTRILRDHERLRDDLDRLESLRGRPPQRPRRARNAAPGQRRPARASAGAHALGGVVPACPRCATPTRGAPSARSGSSPTIGEQRELLDFLNARLRDEAQPAALVARDVDHLVALLRDDMREEEAELLDERVLRDDVVAVDALTS